MLDILLVTCIYPAILNKDFYNRNGTPSDYVKRINIQGVPVNTEASDYWKIDFTDSLDTLGLDKKKNIGVLWVNSNNCVVLKSEVTKNEKSNPINKPNN